MDLFNNAEEKDLLVMEFYVKGSNFPRAAGAHAQKGINTNQRAALDIKIIDLN